jgi:hypothetical protein
MCDMIGSSLTVACLCSTLLVASADFGGFQGFTRGFIGGLCNGNHCDCFQLVIENCNFVVYFECIMCIARASL